MRHQLAMSPDYVRGWGLPEAIRELLQNALDQVRRNPESELILDYDPLQKILRIGATNCELARKTLLLGVSDKRDDKTLIGNEGEGYKLAMLVLCRELYGVEVRTGAELWTASIVKNEDLDCDVLEVAIDTAECHTDGVVFIVTDVSEQQYQSAVERIYVPDAEDNSVVSERQGEIFVGGLRVCHVPECSDGYNFRPGVLTLNRDRDMVKSFDLFYETSRLWQAHPERDIDRLTYHLESRHNDVKFVTSLPSQQASYVLESFKSQHGDSVPVHTDAETKEALAAGCSVAMVGESLCTVLRSVGNFVFKRRKTPHEKLSEWFAKYQTKMDIDASEEFDKILVESRKWLR